ncbi:type II toxin-antitoxin system VapC family toxin [Endozoicomonas sp. 4G]|uniref:type II toxin-antitoxin system VapC family toxin n=1 Tax=Endozoicomonas sp. 4G TaxID=2872754 RepID=UPI00207905CC|nr:type II toxin-antitoxin system VapC family toxin [Endozoicomonas sp. 4G]
MILLDTCALIWTYSNESLLPDKTAEVIHSAIEGGQAYASSISCWEVAMLQKKGRLKLGMKLDLWIAKTESGVEYLPVSNDVALSSVLLPFEFHKDPADRIIVAQSRILSMPIVTSDLAIIDCPHVETIW